jgi:hypothetical protein
MQKNVTSPWPTSLVSETSLTFLKAPMNYVTLPTKEDGSYLCMLIKVVKLTFSS